MLNRTEGPGSSRTGSAAVMRPVSAAGALASKATCVSIVIIVAGAAASFAAEAPADVASPMAAGAGHGYGPARYLYHPVRVSGSEPSTESELSEPTTEHTTEDETSAIRPARTIPSRLSAPARMGTPDTLHVGDTYTADSSSQVTSSASEEPLSLFTTSSFLDGKSPIAEPGSWTEEWERWLFPAADLPKISTPIKGRQGAGGALRARAVDKELKRRGSPATEGFAAEGTPAEESDEKGQHAEEHTSRCLERTSSSEAEDFVPFFDKAIVLPQKLEREVLFIVTMDGGSILLITSSDSACHEANPHDLTKHIYAADAALNSCDFGRLLSWEQVYPLLPRSYVLWRFNGHSYYFREPDNEFLEPRSDVAFCFTLKDVETSKLATFIVQPNGVEGGGPRRELALSAVLTMVAALLPSCM